MIETVNSMIKKFRINVRDIINNSDNTMEDVTNESFIILHNFFDEIKDNEIVFIRELRNKCLKFNKYGKKINSKKDWERFNAYEEKLQYEYKNEFEINEDKICDLNTIKNIICENEYDFLIFYYENGGRDTAIKYNISNGAVRKRVYTLINKIKKELGINGE